MYSKCMFCLGRLREASGRLLGGSWEASGKLLGSFWVASGKLLGNPRKQAERASNQNLFVNSTENLLEFGRVCVTFCPSLLLSSLYITRMYEIFQQESSPAGHRIAFRSESTPPTLAHRQALSFGAKKQTDSRGATQNPEPESRGE